jgi:hypothetical protein
MNKHLLMVHVGLGLVRAWSTQKVRFSAGGPSGPSNFLFKENFVFEFRHKAGVMHIVARSRKMLGPLGPLEKSACILRFFTCDSWAKPRTILGPVQDQIKEYKF